MTIDEAVEILAADREATYLFEREFAVAAFSAWLNWPEEANAIAAYLLVAVNRAVLFFKENDMPVPTDWLYRAYEPEQLISTLDPGLNIPSFSGLDNNPTYNDCRYVADVVRFLLTYKTSSLDKRKRASLGKAALFLNKHGGFVGGRYGRESSDWCAMTGHQSIWRRHRTTAPFQLVRYYGSKIDWLLRPDRPDYIMQLTSTASRRQELVIFFGKALDIQERLLAVLDERASNAESPFSFPSAVERQTCRTPPMPASVYSKMSAQPYKRSWAIKAPVWE